MSGFRLPLEAEYRDFWELPYSEDFALQPRYPYDVSKAATDMIARSYAVTYGLCLQGLGKGALSTNLIPRELIIQRMIRDKKPWALATWARAILPVTSPIA